MPAERSPQRKAPLGADLVIPVLAGAFAIYFFFSIADLTWEAKANGVLIGTILVVLIGIQFVRFGFQLARGEGTRFDVLWQPRDALVKRVGLVALTAVFIVVLQPLGLTLALFLALAAALWLMGVRKPSRLVGVPAAVATSAYLLFIAVLDTGFPRGPIEHLLAAVFQP